MKKTPTLLDSVLLFPQRQSKKAAAMTSTNKGWQNYSWQDYYNKVELFALGLIDIGAKNGDKIAIYANTRFEWSVADLAIMGIGAISVPIYQTVTPDDLEFILNDSQTKILILENKSLYRVYSQIKERCPSVKEVILIEEGEDNKQTFAISWNNIMSRGLEAKNRKASDFAKLASSVAISDLATIIYTSGTTGLPKGALIGHEQIMSEISEAFTFVGATPEDTSLTFLPYAHVLGRVEHWGHVYIGHTLAFSESIEKIRQAMQEIKPTFIISVPRIFEKIYSAILPQIENNFAKSKMFEWALDLGKKVGQYKLERKPIPMDLVLQHQVAQKLILNKITDLFGGRLRFAICGGAPLSNEIALFFHACGIKILEGYGLTETTAAICVNTPFDYQFGSVGKPIGDVEIKIAEDGEILARSKKIMRGYHKNPNATNETIVDGWLHTGDIGEILPSGDIKITDRKKDLIKTAGGKYVAPQKIENLLKANDLISQAHIHGDQKKFVVALLTIEKNRVIQIAKDKNIQYQDYSSLTQHPAILESVRKCVAEANSKLANYETIKRFTVLPQDFTIEAGELTPSMKLKRKVIDQKFKKQIDELYV